jgi:hypothetical protein
METAMTLNSQDTVDTDGPLPGTLAAARPEPHLVTLARRLIDEGMTPESTAEAIVDEASVPEEIKQAGIYFQQRMGRSRASDDGYRSNRVQLALETAYASMRGQPTPSSR